MCQATVSDRSRGTASPTREPRLLVVLCSDCDRLVAPLMLPVVVEAVVVKPLLAMDACRSLPSTTYQLRNVVSTSRAKRSMEVEQE